MPDKERIIKRVQGLFEHEPRINLHRHPIRIDVVEGAVVLEGEVDDIAAKKLALELAASVGGAIRGVVDRLHVVPAERRGDGAIRDSLGMFLLRQPELQGCAIRVRSKGRSETLRETPGTRAGEIEFVVEDGVITLEGTVISLSHKRVAGVLAWWAPGCRDVVNSLGVTPPQEDNEEEVADALRLVLEMDPLVESDRISARVKDFVVTLEGQVRSEAQRRRAEFDAWALFAVDKVVNRLEVRA
jgi:osmotically-inducible protein OsmY